SLYLAYRFVEKEFFMQKVSTFISTELKNNDLYVLHKAIDPVKKEVDLVVYGESGDRKLLDSIRELKVNYGLEDAILTIRKSDNAKSFDATPQSTRLFEEKLKIQSAIIAERERQN